MWSKEKTDNTKWTNLAPYIIPEAVSKFNFGKLKFQKTTIPMKRILSTPVTNNKKQNTDHFDMSPEYMRRNPENNSNQELLLKPIEPQPTGSTNPCNTEHTVETSMDTSEISSLTAVFYCQ